MPPNFPSRNPRMRTTSHHFAAQTNKMPTSTYVRPTVAGVVANQNNNSSFVNFINSNSRFDMMNRDELIEHMYIMEPEIASAIDSFAVMIRESFKYFELLDDTQIDNMPDTLEVDKDRTIEFKNANKNLAEEMVDVANKLAKEWGIEDLFESYAAILMMHGNLFLMINKDLSLSVIPNDRVSIVDKSERVGMSGGSAQGIEDIIMQPNKLVIDETLPTQKILNKDKFYMIRYRDTPLYIQDIRGRLTFNIYSVSPLRRAIMPVWYRRIIMANDALWRAKNVPREHHKLDAESFNTGLFTGTKAEQMRKAENAARQAIMDHMTELEEQAPDQAYVTLNTIEIDNLEPKSISYMQANELIEQMNDSIFSALNLPRSVVKGVSGSNYASELVISSYASTKILQISRKIAKVILSIMRQRLLLINADYPVEFLEINLSYNLANSEMEAFKEVQLMGAMGIFTEDEIRAKVNYKPLTEDQRKEGRIVDTRLKPADYIVDLGQDDSKIHDTASGKSPSGSNTAGGFAKQPNANHGGQQGATSSGSVKYKTTPQSAMKQPTDSAQAVINKASKTPKT